MLNEISGFRRSQLVMDGAIFSALLIVLRLAWTFPGAYLAYIVLTRLFHRNEEWPGARMVFVVGWTGMRGVIALAAAISLPAALATGNLFPQRSMIIFLTFSTILVTLVVQGLSLPLVVRALKLTQAPGVECEQDEARRQILEAALAHLDESRAKADPAFASIYDDLAQHYRQHLASLKCMPADADATAPGHYEQYLDVSRDLLNVERETALRLRREGRIGYEVLREIERELDLSATRLASAEQRGA